MKYQFPRIISALGRSRGERAMNREIGLRVGRRCHVSSKDAVELYLPLIRLFCKESSNIEKVQNYFEFEDEEMEYIVGKKAGKAKPRKRGK